MNYLFIILIIEIIIYKFIIKLVRKLIIINFKNINYNIFNYYFILKVFIIIFINLYF